jgi:hypothetical protein
VYQEILTNAKLNTGKRDQKTKVTEKSIMAAKVHNGL